MIDLSHGEFRALIAKAFRGAGYSWGLTEEAAFAVGYLAEAGFGAAESVVRLLSAVDGRPLSAGMPDGDWFGSSGALCPICVGTSLADQGGCEELTIGATAEPLLIAPFLVNGMTANRSGGSAVESELGYTMTWEGGRCDIASAGIALKGTEPVAPAAITIVRGLVRVGRKDAVRRVVLSSEHFDRLDQFAHRVYAPATEASRAGGAGAGTSDND